MSLFNLENRVAVVTGGTGVLGSRICRELASAGAKVAVLATSTDKTSRLAEEIKQQGSDAIGVQVDVLDRTSLKNAAQDVIKHYGKIDVLINGAGGNKPDGTTSPQRTFFDLPDDAIQWVFNLNFLGTFLASQIFGEYMVAQNSGVILNVSSMASYRPMTRVVAYSAAKAAINNFTHWLAVYLAQQYSPNIRVNAIAPGFFLTEQNRFLLTDERSGELTERGRQILYHTPMARFGEPDDLLGTVIWLVSDASRFVTGIVVPVDGGFSAFGGV